MSPIFIQQNKDVDNVIQELIGLKINSNAAEKLIAKIVTSKKIERDFILF